MGYYFVKTDDNSVGLYDEQVNDIYHSKYGAFQEAIDKFILPAQIERFKNSTCKVLDICYGIGYNTKALLYSSIKNNLNITFEIDAIEINNELINISPFIKQHIKSCIIDEIDKFILYSILNDKQLKNNFEFQKIKSIISKNFEYLTIYKPDFIKILLNEGYKYKVIEKINAFLHNIYYHNISNRHKLYQKTPELSKSTLKWHVNDARKVVKTLSKTYDLIFLDAFTATKQPLLWTQDFLAELVKRLDKNSGMILSYSTASPFRKALLNLNLNVGKYFTEKNKSTLATYNINLVKYKLDKLESELLETKAGIPYRDILLSLSSYEILSNRKYEVENSTLESASKFYKRNKLKHK